MKENIHGVDAEERYRMYLAELNRSSAVLASYCVKCTKPKIINKDGVTNMCENCNHRMIMHKHMEDYKEELLKQHNTMTHDAMIEEKLKTMTPERLKEITDVLSSGLAPRMTQDEAEEVSFIHCRLGFAPPTIVVTKRH